MGLVTQVKIKESPGHQVKALGPDHAEVATSYNGMAGVLDSQGDLEGALALHEKALAIRVKALGPDHTSVGETQYNMAGLAHNAGDMARERELVTEAHRVFAAALGPDHQFTRMAANGLAALG